MVSTAGGVYLDEEIAGGGARGVAAAGGPAHDAPDPFRPDSAGRFSAGTSAAAAGPPSHRSHTPLSARARFEAAHGQQSYAATQHPHHLPPYSRTHTGGSASSPYYSAGGSDEGGDLLALGGGSTMSPSALGMGAPQADTGDLDEVVERVPEPVGYGRRSALERVAGPGYSGGMGIAPTPSSAMIHDDLDFYNEPYRPAGVDGAGNGAFALDDLQGRNAYLPGSANGSGSFVEDGDFGEQPAFDPADGDRYADQPGSVEQAEGDIDDDAAADEEPLYVNAKQYHRILKRRAARARLEEMNQLIRQRKVGVPAAG